MEGDERMERAEGKGRRRMRRRNQIPEVSRKRMTSPESSQLPGLQTDGGIDVIYSNYKGH